MAARRACLGLLSTRWRRYAETHHGLAVKEYSMFIHTVQLAGMFLILLGLCIYAFYIKSRVEKVESELEKLEESFEKHVHCLSCGALNNRCGCK